MTDVNVSAAHGGADAPVRFYRKIVEEGEAGFSVLALQLTLVNELGARARNRRTAVYDAATAADVAAFYASRKHAESSARWDDWGWDTVADVVQAHPAWVGMCAHQQSIDAAGSDRGLKIARVALSVYAYRMNVHYAEVRPYPVCIAVCADSLVYTDCSGFAEDCYKIGGAPDPSNTGFDGSGNTLTQWAHGHAVSTSALAPGDLVFYNNGSGAQPGHVAVYVGGGNVVSNGRYPMDYEAFGYGLPVMGARRYV